MIGFDRGRMNSRIAGCEIGCYVWSEEDLSFVVGVVPVSVQLDVTYSLLVPTCIGISSSAANLPLLQVYNTSGARSRSLTPCLRAPQIDQLRFPHPRD